MESLMTMKLGDIKIYNPWAHAPNGTILQIIAGERVIVGMRTTYKAENGDQDALLILGGEHAGELIVEAYLNGPALDIGAQVEIIAREVIPFGTTAIPFLRAGVLLRHETETNVYFVWSRFPEGTNSGSICIASDNPNFLIGGSYPHLDKSQLIGVARGVDLREL